MAPEADGNSKVEEYKEAFQWLSMVVSAGSGADLWGGVALNKKFELNLPSLSHIIFLHPPPSFHFSMIRGENFANSIANRMSVMPPWLNPRDVFRLYLF